MSDRRIPATVVTGFLGAGKTTLIRNLIRNARGRRIAIVVNEFGDMGFDGGLLSDCGDDECRPDQIVELTNGCICCTVADEFLPTMEALLARDPPPDHIVIETSGLALPQPLVQAFNWPSVRHRVTVDGVVTVVDAVAVSEGRFAPEAESRSPTRRGCMTTRSRSCSRTSSAAPTSCGEQGGPCRARTPSPGSRRSWRATRAPGCRHSGARATACRPRSCSGCRRRRRPTSGVARATMSSRAKSTTTTISTASSRRRRSSPRWTNSAGG